MTQFFCTKKAQKAKLRAFYASRNDLPTNSALMHQKNAQEQV